MNYSKKNMPEKNKYKNSKSTNSKMNEGYKGKKLQESASGAKYPKKYDKSGMTITKGYKKTNKK